MDFVNTPFNYTGSKFKLLEQLIPLFDKSKTRFVDLFAGGGSVYTNIVDIYDKVLVNDLIEDLIGIHKKLILNTADTINSVRSLCVSKIDKIGFHRLRDDYNLNKTPEKLYALILCCNNNMIRFNKKFKCNSTFGKRTYNENTHKKIIRWVDYLKPYRNRLEFKSSNFFDVECDKNDHVYCDPPYGVGQTEAGYNSFWSREDEIKLYEYLNNLNKIGATFSLSGCEVFDGRRCKLIDLLLADGFRKHELDYNYNKVSKKGNKETKEVLITNY
jgi:DNA adenine methylase Dam